MRDTDTGQATEKQKKKKNNMQTHFVVVSFLSCFVILLII